MSEFDINVGDAWKKVTQAHVNVADTWKKINKGYVNVGDAWKLFYSSWTDPSTYTDIYETTDGDLPGLKKGVYCAANSSIWFKLHASSTGYIYLGIGAIDADGTSTADGYFSYYYYNSSGEIVKSSNYSLTSTFIEKAVPGNYSPYTIWVKFTARNSAQYVAAMYTHYNSFLGGLNVNGLYGGGNGSSFDVGNVADNKRYYTCTLRTPALSNTSQHYILQINLTSASSTKWIIKVGRRTTSGTDYTVWNNVITESNLNGTNFSRDVNHQNWNDTGYPAIDWVYSDSTGS